MSIKYLIIAVIASLCIGCAGSPSSYKGKGGPFTIETKNKIFDDSYILSLQDSGLVVVQAGRNSTIYYDSLNAFYIPDSIILYITYNGLTGFDALGALGGYFIGGIGLSSLGISVSLLTDSPVPFSVGMIVGVYGGIIAGGLLAAPQSSFDIKKFNDRELLYYYCKYCGREPDAINNIR